MLRRERWWSLDGAWDFAWDPGGRCSQPAAVAFDASIRVPFAPETPASGIGAVTPHRVCWYRRRFSSPALGNEEQLILHLGAVDHDARVWCNGQLVAEHEGGYTPFTADLTHLLVEGEQELVVRAQDVPDDLEQPRGKQDWEAEPHVVWYPRTSGIWQTVWLEVVPRERVASVHWVADVADWSLEVDVRLERGGAVDELELELVLECEGAPLATDVFAVNGERVRRRIALPDRGLDEQRARLLWSPQSPTLIDARLCLRRVGERTPLDLVHSYTAMRTVRVQGERLLLNERPLYLRLVLDQGYWPHSGLTPPGVEALARDIELVRQLGFNGVRKHQKLEDPRFLRLADERGLLVWEELPSAYSFGARSISRLTRTWLELIERDRSHPCILAWECFNESWGVPDQPRSAAQRDLVAALYHLARALDPTRPVVGNDGWEVGCGDIVCFHDYGDAGELAQRLAQPLDEVLAGDAVPAGPRLLLEGVTRDGRPVALTEFGGIALPLDRDPDASWGEQHVGSREQLAERYERLLAAVGEARGLVGFCYTQLTDTYQETNGLLTSDRAPKVAIERLAAATRGAGGQD